MVDQRRTLSIAMSRAVIERLAGKQRAVHPVDQMGADIGERVALLGARRNTRTGAGSATPETIFIRWCTLVISTPGSSGEPGSCSPNTSRVGVQQPRSARG